MSHRPQPADSSDALMTELATIPNNLGFLVFDLSGKKVHPHSTPNRVFVGCLP